LSKCSLKRELLEEEYIAIDPYARLYTVIRVQKYKTARAVLPCDADRRSLGGPTSAGS
jgi:hypothetical protein